MYIRECLEQDWKLCAPWRYTQTLPKCSLLHKYTISWYMRKCNVTHAPKKECTAFPEPIFAKLTFSTALPLDLAYRLILRLDSELWTEISLMEQQFVVTHTTRQTEIRTFLDSCVTNTPSVEIFCKKKSSCIFAKTWHALSDGHWMSSFYPVSCKTL
jgi:hypothetical protein